MWAKARSASRPQSERNLGGGRGSAARVGWESLARGVSWAEGLKERDSEGPARRFWGADEAQRKHWAWRAGKRKNGVGARLVS